MRTWRWRRWEWWRWARQRRGWWWEGRSRRWRWMWRRRCHGGQQVEQAQRGARVTEQGECRIWLAGPGKSRSQEKPGGDHGGSNYTNNPIGRRALASGAVVFATRNAFLFGRPPGRSRATSGLDGRKVPIIIVKRQARILLPCWGDSDRASRHPSVAASTESNGHEWARPRRRPSPPRDPPAQASAVHLRVFARRPPGVKLERRIPSQHHLAPTAERRKRDNCRRLGSRSRVVRD